MSATTTEPLVFDTNFIGGGWRDSAGGPLPVVNPATLEPVGTAVEGTPEDVDAAVLAAASALRGEWGRTDAAARAEWMERLADELERIGSDVSDLVTDEMGQPVWLSQALSSAVPVNQLRYYAGLGRSLQTESLRDNVVFPGRTRVRREPVGVVGLIVPWNYPQSLLMAKLAPALAVGCTVVVKPAGETPLDALLLAQAVERIGLPAGVVNVVTGGRETGAALVDHPGVQKIAFTGSTAAGRRIAARCGERLVPVTLELGGKSAAVVLDDADAAAVVADLRGNSFLNSGQTCFLLSRVLVPRARRDELVDALVATAQDLRVGDPRSADTELGPLVSDRIRSRVGGLVDRARDDGAAVLTGGRPLDREGYYYEPTVIDGAAPDSEIIQTEVFGPVVAVQEYDDLESAIALANGTAYGLGGAVYSADEDRALEVARRMATGTVGINGYRPDHGSPFGGYKDSGLGREHGPEALENFLATKSIFG
ncbi:aldehyde dehydrogenase family protein [Microbacterium sp. 18062]|uniref:aldehyde dehydrogenase family protein n=1 Tax=Microbacterium sp. 18062 TaxID=2681410 RepID=UPI001358430F|nr:aldehyde dehydrogenase family protein [Microbacterium sp. 18062]